MLRIFMLFFTSWKGICMAITVNARLKTIRTTLKLSQSDFAKGIHLRQSSYARLELEQRGVNNRIIELVATRYGINKDYILTGKGDMFDVRPNLKLQEMIDIFNELDGVFQDYILTQIKEILKVQKRTKEGEERVDG
jgi:transcriptional regulator with XRE-family HTH domain